MAKSENVLHSIDKRMFYLSDDVDNNTIGKICFNLLWLIQDDDEREAKEKSFKREPIKIYINSRGGSIYDMWSLIDIISNSKTPIHTYCTGYAMSAGFQIFISGHKRFASKNATFLYHQLSGWTEGSYENMRQDMDERKRNQEDIESYVLSRTKITKEQLEEVREKKMDWYIHSENFIELGIIDEVD